jgi:hypothetical protein
VLVRHLASARAEATCDRDAAGIDGSALLDLAGVHLST